MKQTPSREVCAEAVKKAFTNYLVEYENYFHGSADTMPHPVTVSDIRTMLLRNMNQDDHGVSIYHIDLPLREYLIDMVIRGRLLPYFTSGMGGFQGSNDSFHLTTYGFQCWREGVDTLPIDRDCIADKCREQFSAIDPVTIEYLKEGATALTKDLYMAAAVCLGAASENEILNLIDYYCNASDDPVDTKKKFEKHRHISGKERMLDKFLRDKNCPEEAKEALDRLESLIRESRNSAGHPRIMKKDETKARLLFAAFPSYMSSVAKIREWIDSESKK